MTATDGGNADIAGANICPPFHGIVTPPSLAPCDIPPFHGHKKTGAKHRLRDERVLLIGE